MSHTNPSLPVAIIGGGPVGLVAASHLLEAGESFLLFEAGPSAGTSIRDWGHVRFFSPWRYLLDPVAAGLLVQRGWESPEPERLPTGREFVEEFLEPLAAHPSLRPHLNFGRRVVGVSRQGVDKVRRDGRDEAPFEIVVRRSDGALEHHLARAVIDASGTWATPNPAGAAGLPAAGEEGYRDRIRYGMPDVLGADRVHHAGRKTLVLGSGHSAFNVILDLVRLGEAAPGTGVTWAVRRSNLGQRFGGGEADALPARGALGERVRALVAEGRLRLETGFRTEAVESAAGGAVRVRGEGGRTIGPVDRIVAATGFRPDLSLLGELRLELDPWLEAPIRLAPLIDPNLHSCGTVRPHGYEELRHPERDAYVVGMKSYGRAPTFLLLTGYEQVRSVVAALSGDMERARAVQLALPETGVCCAAGAEQASAGCCG